MSFKNIEEVQALVDNLGFGKVAMMRTEGQFDATNQAMIAEWERRAASMFVAERSQRVVLQASTRSDSGRGACWGAILSISISVVALVVAIVALFKSGF
nr:hypothetical protein [uncultured Cupriavidus sp.]